MKRVLDIGGRGKNKVGDIGGWVNVRIVTVNLHDFENPDITSDAVSLENVEDESVDGIYSSHTIEHIHYTKTAEMFRNWFKKLKPGGRLEIRCPDAEWLFKSVFEKKIPEQIVPEIVFGRQEEHMTHHNIFWESKLTKELEEAGFTKIRRLRYNKIYLDWWPYDVSFKQYHGLRIDDLVLEAFKE